jgi:hypothetical protein
VPPPATDRDVRRPHRAPTRSLLHFDETRGLTGSAQGVAGYRVGRRAGAPDEMAPSTREQAPVIGFASLSLCPPKQARAYGASRRSLFVQGGRAGLDRRRARSRSECGSGGCPLAGHGGICVREGDDDLLDRVASAVHAFSNVSDHVPRGCPHCDTLLGRGLGGAGRCRPGEALSGGGDGRRCHRRGGLGEGR